MNRKKIVIYSPHAAAAVMIADIMLLSGSRVTCCATPEQTVTVCIREHPDIVVILSVAPFINGSDLIHRIRPDRRRQPVIYVVAWQQAEQAVLSLLDCGVDQYMTFPVCMGRLLHKIESELNTESLT